ncbi:DNA polymerase III subunit chi [Rhodoferax saidenbachensis]|uniref:DNA polymerase III subunit chi n=1 Tax=Rhodoferax saidenbachensis TaxID=1484693 RepID=A0A1P8KA44_9BURK|nr:DNA polymerase III subunit chi [Rhodoferax saidenbachensis]APW42845.1 DNA polymerase III subunit chi [Rhodoferax saidenbachensis]
MTEVAFHFGAPDKLAYTCRLLRKAAGSGARVVVLGDARSVQQLDTDLWALAPTDFLAHCAEGADDSLMQRSAVVLVQQLPADLPHRQVLVNLAEQVPQGFDTFERVIEVVSHDDADRAQARGRWKRYVELGYAITRHDLALKGAN